MKHFYMHKYNLKNLLTGIFCLFSLLAVAQNEVPDGYYDAADGLAGKDLKSALSKIINNANTPSYGSGTWVAFEKIDKTSSGYVWDMYSYNQVTFPGNGSTPSGMNIEHSVANSWWGGTKNDAYKDLYHLYPSNANANSARSNYPLGIPANATTTGAVKVGNNVYGNEYNGKCWEPLDEYKGDFARSYLYMFTCYENINWQKNCTTMLNLNSGTYPMLRDWAADLLVEWCNNDPVSEKELKRAEGIYGIQNNRNPFIDYPELVDYLWGDMAGEPFYFNDNDAPRLIYPKSNQVFTMPEVHYLSSSSMKLTIAAKNITNPVVLEKSGSDESLFVLSETQISPEDAESGKTIMVYFNPQKSGSAELKIKISSANNEFSEKNITISATANEQFQPFEATDVTSKSFTANWAPLSSSSDFEVDVYTKELIEDLGSEVLVSLDFTNGVPTSWTREGYTTISDNSIRLASGSNSGTLTTPALDLSNGATINVTSKMWSSDSGVKLYIKVDGNIVDEIELTDDYEDYEIEIGEYKSDSKISFFAYSGLRLHIDKIEISQPGEKIELKSLVGYPKTVSNVTSHTVNELMPESYYYYTIKALNTSYDKTDEVEVKTLSTENSLDAVSGDKVVIVNTREGVIISGTDNKTIRIFTSNGQLIFEGIGKTGETEIKLSQKGAFIVTLTDENETVSRKINF